MFVAIMAVEANRAAKFAVFETHAEAQAHISAYLERWPEAFAAEAPSLNNADWWIVGQAVSVVPPVPHLADYQAAITAHLDAAAQSRRYDGSISIASYLGSTNPQWAEEAAAFVAWRDAVWVYAYAELDKAMNGQREAPPIAGFVSELPVIIWPEF
ncbi:MAG: hypothetical protein JNK47_12690 [Mesorhizobium sp.]|nr:hypothetical protein [Mesorhizobium sp.]MBL8578078.1 hypothetical protein [Mesorhizobium sp.]